MDYFRNVDGFRIVQCDLFSQFIGHQLLVIGYWRFSVASTFAIYTAAPDRPFAGIVIRWVLAHSSAPNNRKLVTSNFSKTSDIGYRNFQTEKLAASS